MYPRWLCALTKPGSAMRPFASMVSHPCGARATTSSLGPTATMRVPSTSTAPGAWIVPASSMVTIVASRISSVIGYLLRVLSDEAPGRILRVALSSRDG